MDDILDILYVDSYHMWLLCLASHLALFKNIIFKVHSHCSIYQHFIPFCGWIIVYCMYIPQFVYPFIYWLAFGLLPPFGCRLCLHCRRPRLDSWIRKICWRRDRLPTPVFLSSLMAQLLNNLPGMWETWVRSRGWEYPLEKGTATHSSILAWRIPWTT